MKASSKCRVPQMHWILTPGLEFTNEQLQLNEQFTRETKEECFHRIPYLFHTYIPWVRP